VIDVGAIGWAHIGNGAPVLAKCLERDFFPKSEVSGGSLAEGVALLRTVNTAEAGAFGVLIVEHLRSCRRRGRR